MKIGGYVMFLIAVSLIVVTFTSITETGQDQYQNITNVTFTAVENSFSSHIVDPV